MNNSISSISTLKIVKRIVICGSLLVAFLPLVLLGCRPSVGEAITETQLILGTTISVTVYEPAAEAVDAVFSRVREIEQKMSTSEQDYDSTELLEVNRGAAETPVSVSEDTFFVIEAALSYSEVSLGAFDPTVWPVVRLWGFGTADAGIPEAKQLADAAALVDYRNVVLDRRNLSVSLGREGMGIDVGGIAKGFAADEARRILQENGVSRALLDFGGNVLTIGEKSDGTPWRIGLQHPDSQRGRFLGVIETGPSAIVTSGDYERFFIVDGTRYHHIIDPATGYPTRNNLRSVTILAENSIDADALSTAAFVLGVDKGARLIESLPNIEAAFVTDDTVFLTSGMTIADLDPAYEVVSVPLDS